MLLVKKCFSLVNVHLKIALVLESVEFTGNLAVSKNAFEGCTNLGSVKVKESDMALLGNYTFLNCTKLTEADIQGSLSIGESAFYGCTSLKKFDFSKVFSIGKVAFYHCSSLESIVLPENVTVIGNSAFQGYGTEY
ncbi:MAG: leucine-rich repeat domain-containing protein [Anaerobutyricum soehngenii]